jgi:hypothetical protein
MAIGHSRGGASRADSNHPALPCVSAPLLAQGGDFRVSTCVVLCSMSEAHSRNRGLSL